MDPVGRGAGKRGVFAGQHLPRAPQMPWSKPAPPPAGSAWSCPRVTITCALHNPRNQCLVDWHCPRGKKCCQSFCGRKCLSKPSAVPISYGRSSGAPRPPPGSRAGCDEGGSGQGAVSGCQSPPGQAGGQTCGLG